MPHHGLRPLACYTGTTRRCRCNFEEIINMVYKCLEKKRTNYIRLTKSLFQITKLQRRHKIQQHCVFCKDIKDNVELSMKKSTTAKHM